jgi:protocatechuate 3,4-dioxygenase beta subunit
VPVRSRALAAVLALAALLGGAPAPAPGQARCEPTRPDMLGPFYKPGAPERSVTGQGLVVAGAVRSARGCGALAAATLEWWSADGRGQYRDDLRATQRTDAEGRYRYETVAPGPYTGRPPHLHVRVSAPGHRTLVTQVYPRDGERSIAFDFVLVPD